MINCGDDDGECQDSERGRASPVRGGAHVNVALYSKHPARVSAGDVHHGCAGGCGPKDRVGDRGRGAQTNVTMPQRP